MECGNRKLWEAYWDHGKDANVVALLTIRKNCEDDVKARIGNLASLKDA
jgi:hypothetical protein